MRDTLHTFHALSTDPSRGVHHFTTQDHAEALAMKNATHLQMTLSNVLAWREAITEAVEQTHGAGSKVAAAITDALAKAEGVLLRAGKSDNTTN